MSVVRRASGADFEAVAAIERGCAEVAHWSDATWRSGLAGDGNRLVLVAEEEGMVVGFVVVSEVAGVAELEAVAVAPEARGKGIGRELCRRAEALAAERGADSIQLEVRAGNVVALGMYRAMEFAVQGRRRGYYRDPVEDAVLMEKRLRTV